MADIWGASGAPQWLDPTQRHALLTQEGNSLAGGFLNSFARNDDPMMPLRQQEARFQVLDTAARAETAFSNLKEQNRERAAWMEAAPELTPWLTATPEKRDSMATPDPKGSQSALQAIEQTRIKDEQYFARKEATDIRLQTSALMRDRAKANTSWTQAVGAAPPEVQSEIDALPGQGWNLDANGRPLSPSRDALTVYNTWATNNGQNPEKAFGFKPNSVQTAQARGEIQGSLMDKRQQQSMDRIAAHFNNRVDLEKLKTELKKSGYTEEQFVSKHLDSTAKSLIQSGGADIEDSAGKVDESKVLTLARRLLAENYRKAKGAAAKSTPGKPATPPADTTPDWLAKGGGEPENQQQPGQSSKTTASYDSADSVRADYRAGKLTKDQAASILKDKFGYQ